MSPEQRLKVAVVIPVYNRPGSIIEALDSVAAQTCPPERVVVVDDGSQDDTPAAVQRWFDGPGQHLQTQLIRQANAGPAAARNAAVKHCGDCDLLAMQDSDDLWPADYLQRMVAALEAAPDAVAASCDRVNVDTRTDDRELVSMSRLEGSSTESMVMIDYPGTPNTVVRTAAFNAIGGYDPTTRYGEDYQLMLRLSTRGRWVYVPGEPVVVRRYLDRQVDGATEAPHMSQLHPDRWRCLASMLQSFMLDEGGAEHVSGSAWKARVGRVWYRAGRKLTKLGRLDEAHECYRQAAALMPMHLKARWWAWRTAGAAQG